MLTHVLSAAGQGGERLVSGRLTDAQGNGLPGVSIVVKGTMEGTATDADGNYSLTAPIGSVLVFSFVGMQSREVLVTEETLTPLGPSDRRAEPKASKPAPVWNALFSDTTKNTPGVYTLSDQTPVYLQRGPAIAADNVLDIRRRPKISMGLRYGKIRVGNGYLVTTGYPPPPRSGVHVQLNSSATIEKITHLPALQNSYAQGRAVDGQITWRGPDQQELLSWGPIVRSLSLDGSNYPYDRNGRLTSSPSLVRAKTYNPLSLFRTGLGAETGVVVSLPVLRTATLSLGASRNYRQGVIPNSESTKDNFHLQLKSFQVTQALQMDVNAVGSIADGTLLNRGANLSGILGSLLLTPPTFDNANGLGGKKAASSESSYLLPDGSKRSYAPSSVDNPFALIQNYPDREQGTRLFAGSSLRYQITGSFAVTANANVDQQSNEIIFGVPRGFSSSPQGRLTVRKENQKFLSSMITPSFHRYFYDSELKGHISYQYTSQSRELDRLDASGLSENAPFEPLGAESVRVLNKLLSRASHEFIFNAQFHHNWLNLRLTNRSYFSSTVDPESYLNLFPSFSASADLAELLYLDPVHRLKVYSTIARTTREAPLIYSAWTHLTTTSGVEHYNRYFESAEIFFRHGLLPETERKFEAGIDMEGYDRISFELSYFNNTTAHFLTPIHRNGGFELANAARINNAGLTLALSKRFYLRHGHATSAIRWSRVTSMVDALYDGETFIPLAGFSNTGLAIAKGQPFGAIYGTTFLKDDRGNRLIGSDGFPHASNEIQKIGNTLPDWTLGIENSMSWKRFNATFVVDVKKGGDIWNGTRALLDYYGRSEETGKMRDLGSHLFKGVDLSGQPNAMPVALYDPSKPVEENYWMRYGIAGVSENYIEDGSWIRLNEVSFSYTFNLPGAAKTIKASIAGRNLVMITPYSGVDPSSSLFGYANGGGLDLFNLPSTRSFSAQLTLKI